MDRARFLSELKESLEKVNRFGWHLHPIEHPDTHEGIEEQTIGEIINQFNQVWGTLYNNP